MEKQWILEHLIKESLVHDETMGTQQLSKRAAAFNTCFSILYRHLESDAQKGDNDADAIGPPFGLILAVLNNMITLLNGKDPFKVLDKVHVLDQLAQVHSLMESVEGYRRKRAKQYHDKYMSVKMANNIDYASYRGAYEKSKSASTLLEKRFEAGQLVLKRMMLLLHIHQYTLPSRNIQASTLYLKRLFKKNTILPFIHFDPTKLESALYSLTEDIGILINDEDINGLDDCAPLVKFRDEIPFAKALTELDTYARLTHRQVCHDFRGYCFCQDLECSNLKAEKTSIEKICDLEFWNQTV